ncbi:MAG TPA: MBL fold metallo-hydrolase, partial [Blastocatellia bacterium]|nr:MBL fold metallo-hydrolase [Blastocatellia bacterium]
LSGTELGPEFAQSCMGHLELARLAQRAGVRTVVISHVTEQIDQPGVRERIVHEIAEEFDGEVIWGEDLMQLDIFRPSKGES